MRYLTILCLLLFNKLSSQNLVPNQSFEILNYCPINQTDYAAIPNWYSVQQNSPDFYNECASGDGGVPYNFLGYQQPQHGLGYAGVVLYLASPEIEYREYLGVKLTAPLQANVEYCVNFYVSAADSAGLQTNTIGAYLGDSIYPNPQYSITALPYTPQIQSSQYIENNTGWQLISGSYTAQGGEQYLTIGSFTTDPNTTWGPNSAVINQDPENQYYLQSYVYIDNVMVKECKQVGINEEGNNNSIKLYPNPANGFIMLETPPKYNNLQLELYSPTGALIKLITAKPEIKNKVDVSNLATGIYIVKVLDGTTTICHKKILVSN